MGFLSKIRGKEYAFVGDDRYVDSVNSSSYDDSLTRQRDAKNQSHKKKSFLGFKGYTFVGNDQYVDSVNSGSYEDEKQSADESLHRKKTSRFNILKSLPRREIVSEGPTTQNTKCLETPALEFPSVESTDSSARKLTVVATNEGSVEIEKSLSGKMTMSQVEGDKMDGMKSKEESEEDVIKNDKMDGMKSKEESEEVIIKNDKMDGTKSKEEPEKEVIDNESGTGSKERISSDNMSVSGAGNSGIIETEYEGEQDHGIIEVEVVEPASELPPKRGGNGNIRSFGDCFRCTGREAGVTTSEEDSKLDPTHTWSARENAVIQNSSIAFSPSEESAADALIRNEEEDKENIISLSDILTSLPREDHGNSTSIVGSSQSDSSLEAKQLRAKELLAVCNDESQNRSIKSTKSSWCSGRAGKIFGKRSINQREHSKANSMRSKDDHKPKCCSYDPERSSNSLAASEESNLGKFVVDTEEEIGDIEAVQEQAHTQVAINTSSSTRKHANNEVLAESIAKTVTRSMRVDQCENLVSRVSQNSISIHNDKRNATAASWGGRKASKAFGGSMNSTRWAASEPNVTRIRNHEGPSQGGRDLAPTSSIIANNVMEAMDIENKSSVNTANDQARANIIRVKSRSSRTWTSSNKAFGGSMADINRAISEAEAERARTVAKTASSKKEVQQVLISGPSDASFDADQDVANCKSRETNSAQNKKKGRAKTSAAKGRRRSRKRNSSTRSAQSVRQQNATAPQTIPVVIGVSEKTETSGAVPAAANSPNEPQIHVDENDGSSHDSPVVPIVVSANASPGDGGSKSSPAPPCSADPTDAGAAPSETHREGSSVEGSTKVETNTASEKKSCAKNRPQVAGHDAVKLLLPFLATYGQPPLHHYHDSDGVLHLVVP